MAYIGVQPADKYSSYSVQHFTTSATTSYTLDFPVANENEIALFINNVRQEPGSGYAYTASGTSLTLSAATSASDTMYCVFIGKAVQTVTPANGSVTNAMLSGGIESSKLAFASYPYRNLIINGDMSIAQRGATASNLANSNTGYYSVDRFAWAENGDDATIRQSFNQTSDVPTGQGFSTSLKVTTTTASGSPVSNDYHRILHKIEAQNLQHLKFGTSNAEALTLSFWVKCSKTGTGVIFIYQDDSNQGVGGLTYTINSADTWEKKTISIPANTSNGITNDNGNGLQLEFIFNAGSLFTGGSPTGNWETFSNSIRAVGQTFTINDTLNAYYAITGVQLEVGTTASDFEFLPYDVNLQRCKRYLQYVCGNSNIGELTGGFRATGSAQCGMQFTTPMRTAPSVSLVGLRLHDLNDGDNLDVTSIGVVNGSSSNGTWLNMNNSGTGTVAGVCILYGYNASPTAGVQSYGIKVDAEL